MSGRSGILQIVTQLEAGGAQRCAIENAREFRRRGIATETCFLYRKRDVWSGEPGLVCLLGRPPRSIADYITIFHRLWRMLRRRRPETVIAYSHYANVFGCLFALLSGVPKRAANQTGLPDRIPAMARRLDFLFGCAGVYTAIIANSRTTFEALATRPPGYAARLQMVANGIGPPATALTRTEARHRLGIPEATCVFVTVGRLAEVKNHARLIEAMRGIDDAVLLIAGDGECREALARMCSDPALGGRVRLLGEVAPDDLGDLFAAADAFVLPSLWESFGLAAVEAVAAALPVAASDIPALREVLSVETGHGALYFAPDSVEAIADALRTMRDDAALRTEIAASLTPVAQRYGVSAMADGFLEASRHGR